MRTPCRSLSAPHFCLSLSGRSYFQKTRMIRPTSWRRCFLVAVVLAPFIFFSHQICLNKISMADAMAQLQFRLNSQRTHLRRLEDIVVIQIYSRKSHKDPLQDPLQDPVKDPFNYPLRDDSSGSSMHAPRRQSPDRDFFWLGFLRRCEERLGQQQQYRRTLKLLLLLESDVKGVDATTKASSSSFISTETLLNNFTHFSIFD